jgi:hypothetical protein
MTTTILSARVASADAFTIVLRTTPMTPLFLSQITIALNTGLATLVGRVQPGDPTHGGSRTIQADPTDFSRLLGECLPGATVKVTLTYDASYNVSALDCSPAALLTVAQPAS